MLRDTGTSVEQGGQWRCWGQWKLMKAKKSLPMLATVPQQFDLKNNTIETIEKFVSIRPWQTTKLPMMLLWKRHLRTVVPLSKGQVSMPPLCGIPAYRYQQSLSHWITCQDVCVQQSHAAKRLISLLEVNIIRYVAMLLLHNEDQQ